MLPSVHVAHEVVRCTLYRGGYGGPNPQLHAVECFNALHMSRAGLEVVAVFTFPELAPCTASPNAGYTVLPTFATSPHVDFLRTTLRLMPPPPS